jgi:hypothetical protein
MPSADLQDELMNAVCSDDEPAAIAAIDTALARGADLTSDGVEPLFYAAFGRKPTILRHLYSRGASIMTERAANAAMSPEADNRHIDTAMHAAAEHGWLEGLQIMFALDPAALKAAAAFGTVGRTPLCVAAHFGHADCCRFLLQNGADVNGYDVDHAADSALAEAVNEGHFEVVKVLLEHNADPHAPGWMWISPLDRAEQASGESSEAAEIARMVRDAASRHLPHNPPQP